MHILLRFQAYKELGLLMLLVSVAILTFSSLVYFAEKEGHEARDDGKVNAWTFHESFWWGLMTITTVGYDLSPKTFLGKLIGGFCALSGIFILTLPIPIVVNSFASYYKNRLWRNEVKKMAPNEAGKETLFPSFSLRWLKRSASERKRRPRRPRSCRSSAWCPRWRSPSPARPWRRRRRRWRGRRRRRRKKSDRERDQISLYICILYSS